jgi:RimJ/RimL family protein N-acetyltransferase
MSDVNPTGDYWQGQKVRLRPMQSGDWQAIYDEERDSEGIRVFEGGIQFPRSAEQLQARLREMAEQTTKQADSMRWSFVVESLAGEFAGVGNLNSYNGKDGTFSFAIRIFRPFRGRGYAKDALRILLRYGFLELRCQKANSATVSCNEASIRLHESLGFRIEGRIRRNVFTDGQYYDEVLFGMTREEYDALG